MDTKQKIQEMCDGGMSQSAISRHSGVSQPTVSRIKNGVHGWVEPDTAKKIDSVYEVFINKVENKKRLPSLAADFAYEFENNK